MREQSVRIDHLHVVTPISWVGENDRVLFPMPLMRGGSVASLVGDWGVLPEGWVVVLLDEALAAQEVVHAAGVVHRDVKSANLLLEPTGAQRPHLRLSDFGIAIGRDEPRLTTTPGSPGTPGYVAPSSGPEPTRTRARTSSPWPRSVWRCSSGTRRRSPPTSCRRLRSWSSSSSPATRTRPVDRPPPPSSGR